MTLSQTTHGATFAEKLIMENIIIVERTGKTDAKCSNCDRSAAWHVAWKTASMPAPTFVYACEEHHLESMVPLDSPLSPRVWRLTDDWLSLETYLAHSQRLDSEDRLTCQKGHEPARETAS